MKLFSVVSVFVLGLLALASAVPLSPNNDIIINGHCEKCRILNGR
ncbi:bomanin-1-like [Drosophila innubila]|nr:bomanin-1-like [Drosophila innubila]